jgi:hypothetical protein
VEKTKADEMNSFESDADGNGLPDDWLSPLGYQR